MPKTSLFVITARNAPTAVIFRRGPSKQVLLIKWNLKDDSFEIGQWFKGRIYERRCDLSPSGKLLTYFAAKYRAPHPCWTAVSQPPYLTALALWPKQHGAWGGGGLFEAAYTLALNHRDDEFDLADGFTLGKNMRVLPLGAHAGRGEDFPIYHMRLLRDGWVMKQEGTHSDYQQKGPMSWTFSEARIYEKRMLKGRRACTLQMQLHGIGEREGDWYVLDYEVLTGEGETFLKLPRMNWADWDRNGDLLYSERGRLFRLDWGKLCDGGRQSAKELADFSDLTFAQKTAPATATKWPARY
jgi:hypothetical protein